MALMYDILSAVEGAGQPVSTADIARALGVEVESITHQVSKVVRSDNPYLADQGKKHYALTERGTKWLTEKREEATRIASSLSPLAGVRAPANQTAKETETPAETEDDPEEDDYSE